MIDLEMAKSLSTVSDIHNSENIFFKAIVIGTNDHQNNGRVRIRVIDQTLQDHRDITAGNIENYPYAYIMSMRGTNHGFYYLPEFGDMVICVKIGTEYYIIGSESSTLQMPGESQNFTSVTNDFDAASFPNLNEKGFHKYEKEYGAAYHPDSFLLRWRKNDLLFVNTKQVNEKKGTAQKFIEMRTNENMLFQLVDIGNKGFEPGIGDLDMSANKNQKGEITSRQTDYRDIWKGIPQIFGDYWLEDTPLPPKSQGSQYIRLATNIDSSSEMAPPGEYGSENPAKLKGTTRYDDREVFGSFETSKTITEKTQTIKISHSSEHRYLHDGSRDGDLELKKKLKLVIENKDVPDKETGEFNFGHQITLSNTVYKRRVQIMSKKRHLMLFSDIDKDEKILLQSSRKKYLYMEDSEPNFDIMQLHSGLHSITFCNNSSGKGLINQKGETRAVLPDPKSEDASSYLLIQTKGGMRTWYSDSGKRISTITANGHEILLDDANAKIQITTVGGHQIRLDDSGGNITIISNGKTFVTSTAETHVKASVINMDAGKINLNCGAAAPGSAKAKDASKLETPNYARVEKAPDVSTESACCCSDYCDDPEECKKCCEKCKDKKGEERIKCCKECCGKK